MCHSFVTSTAISRAWITQTPITQFHELESFLNGYTNEISNVCLNKVPYEIKGIYYRRAR